MSQEIQVKSVTKPDRCEICHQSDVFDINTQYCTRCNRANNEETNPNPIMPSAKSYILTAPSISELEEKLSALKAKNAEEVEINDFVRLLCSVVAKRYCIGEIAAKKYILSRSSDSEDFAGFLHGMASTERYTKKCLKRFRTIMISYVILLNLFISGLLLYRLSGAIFIGVICVQSVAISFFLLFEYSALEYLFYRRRSEQFANAYYKLQNGADTPDALVAKIKQILNSPEFQTL